MEIPGPRGAKLVTHGLHSGRICGRVLQPFRRFAPDGVIFFSDILVPVQAMGVKVEFDKNGPRLSHPIRTGDDGAGNRSDSSKVRSIFWASPVVSHSP